MDLKKYGNGRISSDDILPFPLFQHFPLSLLEPGVEKAGPDRS
jgi:hypothetical protein